MPIAEYLKTGFLNHAKPSIMSLIASLFTRNKTPELKSLKMRPPKHTKYSGMFLKPPLMNQIVFENKLLRDHIKLPTQTCEFETYDSKESFYFHYKTKYDSLQSSIILFNILEGRFDKDITITSNCSENDIKTLEKDMHYIWKDISSIPDNPVKKIHLISKFKVEREWINNCSPDKGAGRTVTILDPHGFSSNDAFLLGKHAKCSVSSGDLSMSDVLAAGRIPITSISGKADNARAMHKNLDIFSTEYPKYKKQVECTQCLMCAIPNITHRDYSISEIIGEVKLFGTKKWYEFEKSYINYLHSQPNVFLEDKLCNAVRTRLKIKKERCCNMQNSVIRFKLSSFRKDDFTTNIHLNKALGVNCISSLFNSVIVFFIGRTVWLSKEQVNLIIKNADLLNRLEKKGVKKRLIDVVYGQNIDSRMRPSPSKPMIQKQIMNPDKEAQLAPISK